MINKRGPCTCPHKVASLSPSMVSCSLWHWPTNTARADQGYTARSAQWGHCPSCSLLSPLSLHQCPALTKPSMKVCYTSNSHSSPVLEGKETKHFLKTTQQVAAPSFKEANVFTVSCSEKSIAVSREKKMCMWRKLWGRKTYSNDTGPTEAHSHQGGL